MEDADENLLYGLSFSGLSTGIHAYSGDVHDSTDNDFRRNTFTSTSTAIAVDNGREDLIADNTISGMSIIASGLALTVVTASSVGQPLRSLSR